MCGIAGILQTDGRPFDSGLLEAMTGSLAHRGPDGEGYVLLAADGREKPVAVRGSLSASIGHRPGRYEVGLGHRRLAVVDLTPLGAQPMGTPDGRCWVTYNGEIYNAPELRRELQRLGREFRSTSDTEVVLQAFQEWGPGCLDRFNGMFAFALWDAHARRLFCARDRFGIKPFYFREAASGFHFASEIKALRCDPAYRSRPNDRAIYDYLTQGLHDHGTETFHAGIRQLGPGEWLEVRIREAHAGAMQRVIRKGRWYRLPEAREEERNEEETVHRLRDLLEDSVRIELRADVPVGSCLSGGLDSSTLVCLMSRLLPAETARPQTFSLCHDDPRYDERSYIHAVLSQTGADNHVVMPDSHELYDQLGRVLTNQEEPVAGLSILGQWAVMRRAADAGVKVLLDGQGADEVLLGYPGYVGSRLVDLMCEGRWLEGIREWRAWHRLHGRLPRTVQANIVRALAPSGAAWLRSTISGEDSWLSPAFRRQMRQGPRARLERSAAGGAALDAHVRRSLEQDLPALLHYEDRNAMAFSLEARVPFLDHRLVEFLLRVPPEQKLFRGMTKVVLRKAMAGVLPDCVNARTDKMGFVMPEDLWLRRNWRPHIETLLSSERVRARPYWQAAALKRQYGRYCDQGLAIGPTVWRWMNLELWLRAYCD
jgi:asparagine synthase (glutamine-hydrolysing)